MVNCRQPCSLLFILTTLTCCLPAAICHTVNLTAVLENAGCDIFASLISSSGMIKILQAAAVDRGLTLFAPSDEAFNAKGVPDMSSLSSADVVTLLQYHAVDEYVSKDWLKRAHHPIATMASGDVGNYEINVSAKGDEVVVHTGVDSSLVVGTLMDRRPVCILKLESVLLPRELFGKMLPSPSPSPLQAPSPSPLPLQAPSPSPRGMSPSIARPPLESPVKAPKADSPDKVTDEDDKSEAIVATVRSFCAVMAAAVALSW